MFEETYILLTYNGNLNIVANPRKVSNLIELLPTVLSFHIAQHGVAATL